MTKTRNNKNRSRKAKATVRTNKPRSPQAVTKEINAGKVKAALNSTTFTQEPQYRIEITFVLNNTHDINEPIRWLEAKMGEKMIDRLNTGSGTCLMTGLRDFGFEGSKAEMTALLKCFSTCPFRINNIYTDTVVIV